MTWLHTVICRVRHLTLPTLKVDNTFIVHSNKYNWTQLSKSMSWIHKKKPHIFNTTSWRCPPWPSKHCCHLPGILAMTWHRVSCVTFTISWIIAFLRLLISGRVWVKPWAFKYAHKKRSAALRSSEMEGHWMSPNRERSHQGNAAQRVFTESRAVWAVRLFLWIQDTDILNRIQLYLLLCTINVLSYFQIG
jgi:hypothetical protein